jgi:hypothetical protein
VLFRMSLIHLPLFLAMYVFHREPNYGQWTWDRLLLKFQRGTEDAERTFVSYTRSSEPSLPAAGMLFPFSPPIAMPCPFHVAKEGVERIKEGVKARLPDASIADRQEHVPCPDLVAKGPT